MKITLNGQATVKYLYFIFEDRMRIKANFSFLTGELN